MPRRKSLGRRLVEGYFAAVKRSSDMIYKVPGGENRVVPGPPVLPEPPWAESEDRQRRSAKPDSWLKILAILFGLMVGTYAILLIGQATGQ